MYIATIITRGTCNCRQAVFDYIEDADAYVKFHRKLLTTEFITEVSDDGEFFIGEDLTRKARLRHYGLSEQQEYGGEN